MGQLVEHLTQFWLESWSLGSGSGLHVKSAWESGLHVKSAWESLSLRPSSSLLSLSNGLTFFKNQFFSNINSYNTFCYWIFVYKVKFSLPARKILPHKNWRAYPEELNWETCEWLFLRQHILKIWMTNYTCLLSELPFSTSSKTWSPVTLIVYIFARLRAIPDVIWVHL